MKTLLEITQNILSDMSGDQVDSITDTEESEQVARIIISTFDAIVSRTEWPKHKKLLTLVPYTDSSKPNYMKLPDAVKAVVSVFYDKHKLGETRKLYQEVKYKNPEDFLRYINVRNSDNTNVETVVDESGIELLVMNNQAPLYYTSFDDVTLIFDSYDTSVESTLQANKFQITAYVLPSLAFDNNAIPDLPLDAESLLVEEATSRCQFKVAEVQDLKAEQEANRQKRAISRKAWRVNSNRRWPDYGRKR